MNYKIILPILFAIILSVTIPSAFAFTSTDNLYTCGTNGETDRLIYLRDINGTAISSVAWNITGLTSQTGCNGMAQDPTDGTWYAIVKDLFGRNLVSFDPTTGNGTALGVINDSTANSLTITNNGTFYATNGDTNDQLFKIDKTDPTVHLADCSLDSDNEEFNRIGWNYDTDKGMITTNSDQGSAFVTASTFTHFSGFSGSCPMSVVESFVQDPNYNVLQTNYCHPFANNYHTEDDVFYAFHQDCIGGGNTYYASLDPVTFDATLINAVSTSGSTAPLKDLVPQYFTGGMQFELAFAVSDTTPPVISRVGETPTNINQFGTYTELGATCLDDVDGQIDQNVVISGDTVDDDTVGTYIIDYDCQDTALNDAITVQMIVNVLDATMPLISPNESEPITLIQGSSFSVFDKVSCNDAVDGSIVPNGDFATDGAITVFTDNRGIYFQEYTCTDSANNETLRTIEYIVKKVSTGSSGVTSFSQSSGNTLANTPPLFSFSPQEDTTTDQGTTFTDLFANLFDNRLGVDGETVTDSTPAPTPSQSAQSTSTPVLSDTVQAIQDFFRNLFSFFG